MNKGCTDFWMVTYLLQISSFFIKYLCSRKNFKLSFSAGIALAVGVRIYIFRPMRMTNAILPRSSPWGNIKGRANHFSLSSCFPHSQQQDRPANMTEHILFSLPHWLAAGQASQYDRAHTFLASSLASSRTSQSTSQSTYSSLRFLAAGKTSQNEGAHSLFFTDSSSLTLSHILSGPLSTIRRAHSIYGPLMFGKSFFHHSSFLLNQWILRETNWIFSTPVLTSAF